MKMTVKEINKTTIKLPTGRFASDWFKCEKCGYSELKLIPPWQKTSTCSKCGGTAYRL